ncbi:MAG TPA: metallophosphoesterase [candidate division Zixibacteria bacterium]|nr:metallophosphoesterase [candidate division Zixibacteria bacterium]
MKIAITADLHLTDKDRNPERFETFERLLADLRAAKVGTLIIAGDLFDASRQNYADFERLCRRQENQEIKIYVIPGNHDPTISSRSITADNLEIIDTPSLLDFDTLQFLFIPYLPGKTMGEEIARFSDRLPAQEWVLIGHGDWAGGMRTHNPAEPGVYMPLTRKDIEIYKPARVFLGHIHAPMDEAPVHYVGSPCGLDINETGRRRCLLYDTGTDLVDTHVLDTPVLYFNESFVIVPVEDEDAYLRAQISSRMEKWDLNSEERAKTQLRVKVSGFSADKAALRALLQEEFDGFSFYKEQEPDIDEVSVSEDREREYIAEQVRAKVVELAWPGGADEPSPDEILLKALHIIYKR